VSWITHTVKFVSKTGDRVRADEPELSRLKSDIGVDEAAAAAVASSIKPNDWQRIGGHHAFQLAGKSAKPVGRDRKGEVDLSLTPVKRRGQT
jgi:hypothetical protein